MADPDVVVRDEPAVCAGCGGGLAAAAQVGVVRRQVFDVPEPKVEVTEHQVVTLACRCGHRSTGAAPAGVTAPVVYGPRLAGIGVYLLHGQFLSVSRTADALRDLFGTPVAAGTVACWVKRTALGVIDRVLPVIAGRIAAAPVAHFDETGLRTAGGLAWLHTSGGQADPAAIAEQEHLLRSAVVLGAQATADRTDKLQRKHHALFARLRDRRDDYLRFVTNPAVPFDNNPAEQTIRMPKLRIKVSGCMRTLTGAEHFAAIRSYTATATRHGINTLHALTTAAAGNPWTPTTT